MKYFGTGDQGGAPDEASVAWLQRSLAGTGPVAVRSSSPDQIAVELAGRGDAQWRSRMPRYDGELLMTSHGPAATRRRRR